ncbi:hypothetical protein KAR91_12520 [Candidatus Pacearchaeota archaeon]|nr:hypothetical protein [Candidatus Pacearchaeota archaeon]
MKDIEIIVEAENAQIVLDALEAKGIKHRSIKDLEAVARIGKPKENSEGCCGQGKKSPSLSTKAKNYIKTMARWTKAGMPKVDKATELARLNICSTCEAIADDGWECTECGCPMKDKVEMDIEKLCELKKW